MSLLLAFMLAAAAPPIVVSSLESAHLAEECKGKDSDPAATFCTGYIMGVFDALSLSRQICPSAKQGFTLDAVAAVRKYLRTNPDKWSSAPSFVVRDALRAEFPCRRK